MATDTEIVVQLTAEQAQLQAGMEQGAATVQAATEKMQASIAQESAAFNAAVQAKIDAQVRLNTAFAGGISSTEGIAAAEAALDQAMAAGAVTAAEYAGYVGKLDASEIELATSTAAATTATEANTVALQINGGVAREVGVLVGELARGNYTRLEGSTITLANRTGFLSSALGFLISPLGLVTEATAALGVAAYQAAEDEEKLRDALINSGDMSGYSADQLKAMQRGLVETGATANQARDAIVAVTSAGNLLGANFETAAQAAVDMAQLTGISIEKAVGEISKLQQDPVKSIQKLNETMNFLSPTEAAQIKHLSDIGDKAGAAALAISDLASAEAGRVKEQRDAGGGAESFTGKLSADAQSVWSGIKGIFSKGDLQEQLDTVNKELTQYSEQFKGSITQDTNNQLQVDTSKLSQYQAQELNKLLQQREQLMAQITAEGNRQTAQAAKAQADQTAVNTILKPSKADGGAKKTDDEETQADRDAYNEQRLNHQMSLADEQKYWQDKLEAATQGTRRYRQAVEELLQIKTKEGSESKAEAREEIADAKRIAEEKVRAAKEAERAQEEAARKQRALSLEQIKATHDETIGELANKRDGYEQQYADGQISAKQLLQLESDLMTQKLAADRAYYEAKAKLDAADPVAVAKDDAAIIKAQQDAVATMLKNEKEFHNNSEKQWDGYAKKVEGAMQGAINGMLFQHQKLRQGIASVAMVIGEDFIQQAVMKPLDAWISAEASKVAASISTSTSLQVQRAANSAADATASAAAVARATGVAGAQGTASFAGAPWPVDMGAPAFGAAMAAVSASYGAVASAAGGWERVPIDGMMTELHKDEMVLPAHIANPMRDMAKNGANGGSGGGNHFHVNAVDTRTFADAIRRNPRAMAETIKKAHRMGHLGGVR